MRNEEVQKTVDLNMNQNPSAADETDVPTFIVVSKVKSYIRQQASLNTSQCAIDALSKKVADEAIAAINRAKEAGRKTVMGRDFL